MKASSILTIKSWLSKLHPPLPRTARESQQLLSVLTSSFQRQLDEAHPPIERRGRSHSTPPIPNTTSEDTLRRIESLIASPSSTSQYPDIVLSSATSGTNVSSFDAGDAVRRGSHDLESLLRFLNAKKSELKSGRGTNTDAQYNEDVLSTWFDDASLSARTSVLRSRPILYAIRDLLPRSTFITLMWGHVKSFVAQSSQIVTLEEAEAMSTSMSTLFKSTGRAAMSRSADFFFEIVDIFHARGYRMRSLEERSSKNFPVASHPLTQPAEILVFFIMTHPQSHDLSAQHFNTLLNISDLWDNRSLLRSEFVKAFYPTNPDPSYVIRAMRDPETRVAYSLRLKGMQGIARRYSPLGPLRYVHQALLHMGTDPDSEELIRAFLWAHQNGEDVLDLSKALEHMKAQRYSYEGLNNHHIAWS